MSAWRACAACLVVAWCALAWGCASGPSRSERAVLQQRLELSSELLDLADSIGAQFQASYVQAVAADVSPKQLAIAAVARNEGSNNVRAIVLGLNPWGDLVDLYVWAHIAEAACRNRVRLRPDLVVNNCDSTFGLIRERVEELARKRLDPDLLARVDAAIGQYLAGHPDSVTAGLFRLQDLEDRTGLRIPTSETMDWDLGSISEAARQLEETRLLGQQFLWLVSRLPTAFGWEAQGAVYLANAQDTLLSLDHGLAEVSSGLAGTSQHLNDVADRMDKLGIGVRGLHQGLTGSEGLRGIVRETLVTGGLVMAALIVFGTFCALLVVRRLREPRK
jgi:hypothetical protein